MANKTYIFTVFQLIPGTTCHYKSIEVRKVAATFEEALALLSETNPEHHVAEHVKGLWRIEGEEEREQSMGDVR
jgi:hypothetical protein